MDFIFREKDPKASLYVANTDKDSVIAVCRTSTVFPYSAGQGGKT